MAEIDADPFLGMKPPRVDAKVVSVLSADDMKLTVKARAGKELRDRRDEAMLRLLAETGMCAAFNLGVPPGDIPGRLGANDGRENYWTAQRQSAWPIIEGDCG